VCGWKRWQTNNMAAKSLGRRADGEASGSPTKATAGQSPANGSPRAIGSPTMGVASRCQDMIDCRIVKKPLHRKGNDEGRCHKQKVQMSSKIRMWLSVQG